MLHFLPSDILEHVINGILILGVILSIIGFFVLNRLLLWLPPLANFYKIIQFAGIVLLLTGVYFKGSYNTELEWRQQVDALKKQVEIAEQKSKDATVRIEEKVVTKIKVIKEKGKTIIVDRPAIKEFDKVCPIPKEVIEVHNEAVDMNLIIENKAQGTKK